MKKLFISRSFVKVLLILSSFLHAIVITFYWYLMPRGFTWFSRPFIEHQMIIPIVALVSWLAAFSLVWRFRVGQFCIYILLGFWIGMGLINIIWFPVFYLPGKLIVVGIATLVMIIGGLLLILFGWLQSFKLSDSHPMRGVTRGIAICFGAVLPFLVLFISRAGPAQTNPSEVIPKLEPLSEMTTISDQERDIGVGEPSESVQVSLNRSHPIITISTPKGTLEIWPYMYFGSIAQKGFWAIWGNRDSSYTEIERVDRGQYEGADVLYVVWSAKSFKSWLKPGELSGETLIEQRQLEDRSAEIQITTIIRLTRQIDTHQSIYCGLEWLGKEPITLSIGPEQPYNLVPTASDYPFGAPATFMTVTNDRVVLLKTSSAEKGPFKTLASFPKENPVFRIMAANRPVCQFVLEGFVEQASQELSPTAGWGIPVNDIFLEAAQFTADQPSGVWFGFTLAATGLGRGFHAVGTAPGIYVSKLRVSIPLEDL
jgi:hypothetical protein